MKKKIVAILSGIVDDLDVSHNVDKSDTLVGKHVIMDAQDLECIIVDIKRVIIIIKNVKDFKE